MEAVQIELEKRTETGKGSARKTRDGGKIPGILYGHKNEPVMFSADSHGFGQLLNKSDFGRNQLLDVRGVDRDVTVLIKDIQVHPVSRRILHLDLIEVKDDDRVTVTVPVRHEGRAAGQSAGGTLQLLMRNVKVTCNPRQIPSAITIDVRPLGLGDSVLVGDLAIPEGAETIGNQKLIVLTVKAPRVSGKAQDEGDDYASSSPSS
ncbi:MAG: 50S ribosomal protein L25, partial [Myxococcota bacterium]